MKLSKTCVVASLLLTSMLLSQATYAIPKAFPLFAPSCKEKRIRNIIGGALVNLTKLKFGDDLYSYNVTIETSQMTYEDVIDKLEKRGCFYE